MMNFQGEHLVMHKALPHHTSITYFVNSWMKGNHKNLKSIISYNRCGWHINIDIVLDDLKPEKWDETKRPRYFEYTSV
ncbi:hypothetical protein CAEBREN_24776 [Caenorhabditis brenneri]|uniref:F-box associated domain-containing protein n=1 Tax=Caenorhabditis brenneri TaxID=135651 RepID=G0P770_CAEBE|nr:hypothetical protein CAEBREN_24776 [Caenorhabditis brenneri]